jgi:hypothetical protein
MFCCDRVNLLTCSLTETQKAHLEVANNRLKSIATGTDDLLHNVAKVVHQEVKGLSVLCD